MLAVSKSAQLLLTLSTFRKCLQHPLLLVCRGCDFAKLPECLVLKIFATAEGQHGKPQTSDYEAISDDDLEALIDGFQTRLGLPLVCKRWRKLLAQPTYVWESVSIVLHEVWNVQQVCPPPLPYAQMCW